MNFSITEPAAKWFIREMDVKEGDYVRFYVRQGGSGTVHAGFSLGISNDEPDDIAFKTVEQGITFYVEEKDEWYFEGMDFHIRYKQEDDEVRYDIRKSE